jgi:outer membrane protein assembly factor BamB
VSVVAILAMASLDHVGAAQGARPSARPTLPVTLLSGGAMDVRWEAPFDVSASASPVFDDATAYVLTREREIVALDLATGTARWRVAATSAHAPAVGAGTVYVVMEDGVEAVTASTGAPLWWQALDGTPAAPPYFDTGWIIVSLEGGDLVALRASDGHVVWRTALQAVAQVPPVPAGDRLYLALSDGRTVAVSLASGEVLWRRPLDGRASGLASAVDQILVGTTSGWLVSLDASDGRVRWRWRIGAAVAGAPAADARRIYVIGFDHVLRALDRRTGNLRWRRALPHRPAGGPSVVGDTVLVPSLSTELVGYAATTGEPSLSITSTSEVGSAMHFLERARPTATRLVAVTTEGRLVGFGPRIEPAPEPLGDLPGAAVPDVAVAVAPQPPSAVPPALVR